MANIWRIRVLLADHRQCCSTCTENSATSYLPYTVNRVSPMLGSVPTVTAATCGFWRMQADRHTARHTDTPSQYLTSLLGWSENNKTLTHATWLQKQNRTQEAASIVEALYMALHKNVTINQSINLYLNQTQRSISNTIKNTHMHTHTHWKL